MIVKRAASIPLAVHDPYFSVWSNHDRLNGQDPVHWSGIRQQIRGHVTVDGICYAFMGDPASMETIPQTGISVTPTKTTYCFGNEKLSLCVSFVSPLLLQNPTLVSRPCTYVDVTVEKKDAAKVKVDIWASDDLVCQKLDRLVGGSYQRQSCPGQPAYTYAFMGRAQQQPLGGSGDNVTIDWGYVYLASASLDAQLCYDENNRRIGCCLDLTQKETDGLILAFDDLLSINYFGQWCKAYWTHVYKDILDAAGAAFADKEEVLAKAAGLDEEIMQKAEQIGGKEYAFLCAMSYRHAIAAHKLILDEEKNLLFLSKENDSNGCIGTVDVSYPSVPLFLLYDTEYVKGMLRPIFKFADCGVWEYDFAPHDVGRYPYAWGQVYGLNPEGTGRICSRDPGNVFPPFYQYPKGSRVYGLRGQMPVEECGNMLIMTAAVCLADKDASFAKPYMDTLKKWTRYLLEYGADPGEQLCTDDFAGHLSHNVNLSAKAIMGIEAYARLAGLCGDSKEAQTYHEQAQKMAQDWEKRAAAGDHYALVFGDSGTWSLKYNLVWDKLFGSKLFSEEVYQKELAYYAQKSNAYGIPLDSRKEYTKSDWILWCCAMTQDKEQASRFIAPIAKYLEETDSRFPFSDWYDTVTGQYCHFKARSVQGGIFMPMLMAQKERFS